MLEYMVNGKKYFLESDLHTHTIYSHGKGTIEDNVLAARAKGIMKIGITDHGPAHVTYGIDKLKYSEMKSEILRLREAYPDMEILFGVEANILGSEGRIDVKSKDIDVFDYICAGYHYGTLGGGTFSSLLTWGHNLIARTPEKATKAQIRQNTSDIVAALENNHIMFLTHPGDKAPVDLLEIAAVCARVGTLVEINTWHASLSAKDIEMMMLADIKFIVNSDAHTSDRVGDFFSAVDLLIDAGVDMNRVVNVRVE